MTLECNEFLRPIFVVNDSVLPKATGNFSDAPTIKTIQITKGGCVIELSSQISSLKVGDGLFQVVEGEDGKAVYPVTSPQGLSIGAELLGTTVGHFETSLDVTTSSKGGYFYERRVPPIPEEFKEGHLLKTNHNIQFTGSL
ncbi:MAG: hypothetical protein LIP01_11800 [Tannerellaceae bacterium]|nr:hypothetical protein [Tannerellaceae bacterium]